MNTLLDDGCYVQGVEIKLLSGEVALFEFWRFLWRGEICFKVFKMDFSDWTLHQVGGNYDSPGVAFDELLKAWGCKISEIAKINVRDSFDVISYTLLVERLSADKILQYGKRVDPV